MSRVLAESHEEYYKVECFFPDIPPEHDDNTKNVWIRNHQRHSSPEEAEEAAKVLTNTKGATDSRIVKITRDTKEVILDKDG